MVPLAAALAQALTAREMPTDGWLFPRRDGKPGHLSSSRIGQIGNGYLHSIGIDHTLHTLRHWFGTNLYRDTLDLRLTQELLGHTNPAATALYAAYSPPKAAAAVARLGNVINLC